MQTPTLRGYQKDAIAHVLSTAAHTLLVSPTGSGKTIIGAALVAALGGRTLWVSHRRELAVQAAIAIEQATGFRPAIAMDGTPLPGNLEQVCITSPATIKNRELTYYPDQVIIDEAHHSAASTWQDLFDRLSGVRRIGLTATPQRSDGAGLGDLFETLHVVTTHEQLLLENRIVPLRIFAP